MIALNIQRKILNKIFPSLTIYYMCIQAKYLKAENLIYQKEKYIWTLISVQIKVGSALYWLSFASEIKTLLWKLFWAKHINTVLFLFYRMAVLPEMCITNL